MAHVFPWTATKALARTLTDALPEAHVTTEAETATPAVLAGQVAVILSAPRLVADLPTMAYVWRAAVVGAPVADLDAAGLALDAALSAIAGAPDVELGDAEPITWSGAQTSQAPAYLFNLTVRYPLS